jgi:hypothetical protein
MTRQQQQEIRSYAEKVGLKVVRFEKRSKHEAAILSNGRRSRFITLASTPSDFRAGYAVQQNIRKVARELRELEPVAPTLAPHHRVVASPPSAKLTPWLGRAGHHPIKPKRNRRRRRRGPKLGRSQWL